VGVALGSIANDGYFFALDQGEIGILVVISLGHYTFPLCTAWLNFFLGEIAIDLLFRQILFDWRARRTIL
jgi:hypothetical protein